MKRPRGSGTVYARKKADGSLGWWVKFYRNGEQIVRNAHTSDRDEALGLLAKLLAEKAEGKPIARRQLTLQGAADHANRIARNKGKNESAAFEKRLIPFFKGSTPMSRVTPVEIERYKEHRLKAGAANATINRELEALRRAFTLAVRAGLISSRPHVERLPEDNVRHGFFERDEFEAVRRHLPGKRKKPLTDAQIEKHPLAAVATFGYVTGWRKGEALGLRWKNVDFEAGTVRLEPGTTKNKDGRTFVMTAELRRVLEGQRRDSDTSESLVFRRKNGAAIVTFGKKMVGCVSGRGHSGPR